MCKKAVSKVSHMLKYFLDQYETNRISEKAVDACLPALKFVPHWFVAPQMLEYTDNAVLFNDDIDFDHGDPD